MENNQLLKPKVNRPKRRLHEAPEIVVESLVDSDSPKLKSPPSEMYEPPSEARISLVPKAEEILHKYIVGAMGFSLIPIPVLDIAALVPLHLSMVAELADLYDVPFKRDRDKSALAGTVSGLFAQVIVTSKFGLMARAIPVFGTLIGWLSFPILAGASTYAVGHVFIRHFESGGTLLDFKADKVKLFLKRQFDEGKKAVVAMRSGT